MKTMKNFAAQQLSKKEMNNVKGGRAYCSLIDTQEADFLPMDGFYVESTAEEAKRQIDEAFIGTNIVAICHDSNY